MRKLSSAALIATLAGVGRRLLAEPGSRRRRNMFRGNTYSPNGDKEVRRRLRQEIRALAKRAIEVLPSGAYVSVWDQLNANEEYTQKFKRASQEQLLNIRHNLLADLEGASNVS